MDNCAQLCFASLDRVSLLLMVDGVMMMVFLKLLPPGTSTVLRRTETVANSKNLNLNFCCHHQYDEKLSYSGATGGTTVCIEALWATFWVLDGSVLKRTAE